MPKGLVIMTAILYFIAAIGCFQKGNSLEALALIGWGCGNFAFGLML